MNFIGKLTEKQLILLTAFFSVLLSIWLIVSNDIISRDSTLYIKIAQTFLDDGAIEAFKLWGWPFYSILNKKH